MLVEFLLQSRAQAGGIRNTRGVRGCEGTAVAVFPRAFVHFSLGDGCPEDLLSPRDLLPLSATAQLLAKGHQLSSHVNLSQTPPKGENTFFGIRVWIHPSRNLSPDKTPAGWEGGRSNELEMPSSTSALRMSHVSSQHGQALQEPHTHGRGSQGKL